MKRRYIFHISDIHIRPGHDTRLDEQSARVAEYQSVFNRITDFVRSLPSEQREAMLILITGDLVHDNKKIGASGIRLFYDFITALASLAHVVVIRGNHDYNQASNWDQDLLTSLLSSCVSPTITYWNETGVYTVDELTFGLVAIQDVLKQGDTHGVGERPKFPQVEKGALNIALFHGDIKYVSLSELRTQHYTHLLLGDTHQQTGNGTLTTPGQEPKAVDAERTIYHLGTYAPPENGDVFWAYAGSTIQQNHGESLLGHGFILWDMLESTATYYHVKNDYGFETAEYQSLPPETEWLPKNIRFLKARNNTHDEASAVVDFSSTLSQRLFESEQNVFSGAKEWVSYLKDHAGLKEGVNQWEPWIHAPETMMREFLSQHLHRADQERLERRLNRAIADYDNMALHERNTQHANNVLRLKRMTWSYILCYGADNTFDFEKLAGRTHCISGKNGHGKTSFLETICIALFGRGFPSRTMRQSKNTLVCQASPKHRGETHIVFEVNGITYELKRLVKQATMDVTLLGPDGAELQTGKRATDEWIARMLGPIESYLSSGIITQAGDEDFFDKKSQEQQSMLERQMGLEHSSHMAVLLKTSAAVAGEAEQSLCVALNVKVAALEKTPDYEAELSNMQGRASLLQERVDRLHKREVLDPETLAFAQHHGLPTHDLKEVPIVTIPQDLDAQIKRQHARIQAQQGVVASLSHIQEPSQVKPDTLPGISEEQYLGWERDLNVLQVKYVHPKEGATPVKALTLKTHVPSVPDLQKRVEYVKGQMDQLKRGDLSDAPAPIKKHAVSHGLCDEDAIERALVSSFSDTRERNPKTLDADLDSVRRRIAKLRMNILNDIPEPSFAKPTELPSVGASEYEAWKRDFDRLAPKYPNIEPTNTTLVVQHLTPLHLDWTLSAEQLEMRPHLHVIDRLVEIRKKLVENEQLFSKVFCELNPECPVCMANPLKKRQDALKEEHWALELEEKALEALHPLFETKDAAVLKKAKKEIEEIAKYLDKEAAYVCTLKRREAHQEEQRVLRHQMQVWLDYERVAKEREVLKELEAEEQRLLELRSRQPMNQLVEMVHEELKALESKYHEAQVQLRSTVDYLDQEQGYFAYLKSVEPEQQKQKAARELFKAWFEYEKVAREKETLYTLEMEAAKLRDLEAQKPMQELLGRLQADLRTAELELKKVHTEMDHVRQRMQEKEALKQEVDELRAEYERVVGCHALIETLVTCFSNYKGWVLETKILPGIERRINALLELLCQNHRTIRLQCHYATFTWFLQDGSMRIPFEKISGYQRFMVSLAMRLVMGGMGLNGIRNTQLFIDEGFTACDLDNLRIVPDILQKLLQLYETVVVVTHLEELKEHIASHIPIARGADEMSRLVM